MNLILFLILCCFVGYWIFMFLVIYYGRRDMKPEDKKLVKRKSFFQNRRGRL